MTAAQFVGSLGFFAVTALTPFLKVEFSLSNSGVGLLVISTYAGYLLTLLPGGLITDRFGERWVLGGSFVSIAAGGVMLVLGTSYWAVAAGLFIIGMGYGPVPSATNKGIFDWYPAHRRATGLSIKQTGVMGGTALGAATLPTLAVTRGWRVSMSTVVVVVVLSLVVIAGYSRPTDAPLRARDATTSVARQLWEMLSLARNPKFGPLLVCGFFFGASQFTLTSYVLLYLTESIAVDAGVAGFLYTGMLLSGAAGRIVLGVVTDSHFTNRKYLLLTGVGVLGSLAYVPVAALTADSSTPFVALALIGVGAFALGYNGVYLTIAGELVADDETGSGTAVSVLVIIFGAVVVPPVFGFAVDTTGGYVIPLAMLAVSMLLAALASLRIGSYVAD